MGNANSPQRGGAGFLHDPLLASPSSAAAAAAVAAAAAAAAGGANGAASHHGAGEAADGHAGAGASSPGDGSRHEQHRQRHAQVLEGKAAAVASPGGVAHPHPMQQEGCGLMLGGEDSMSAWLDGPARHADPQEVRF